MARRGLWLLTALAIPATVALAPVNTSQAARWEPQVAVGPVKVVPPAAALATAHLGLHPGAAAAPNAAGPKAVRAALTRLGAPYSWAAAGPDAFDCSGLVVWAFEQAGVSLPHSSQALAAGGQPVSLDRMRPGDVIAYYSDASHVGIYVGKGKMVHASTYGVPVAVVPIDNAPIFNARRYR